MTVEVGEYRLSCELRGHEGDVIKVCICSGLGFASSSRDRTVRLWIPDPEKKHRYLCSRILAGHSSFGGPLAWIPPNEQFVGGAIVSGGTDALVVLWDLSAAGVAETMKGHKLEVTGLIINDNGDIISSSIDCTIRRWNKGKAVQCWEGHKVSVQAVVKLPSGELVTGSSDSTLKLWGGRTCLLTLSGHTDTVRGLAVMPGTGILSASHDRSIRLWTKAGNVLLEMLGHTDFVYSVDAHTSGLVASGSEDCFLKIWKDGVCVQSIEHPGRVWDVKFLENGDIMTACSDGAVRIWTTNKDRMSEAFQLEAYTVKLSYYKNTRKGVGCLKSADLRGSRSLHIPGCASIPPFTHIPKRGMLLFGTAELDDTLKKLTEFNTKLASDMAYIQVPKHKIKVSIFIKSRQMQEQTSLSLTETELSRLAAIINVLKDTSHYHCSTFANTDMALLLKILKSWPTPMMFPAIDILGMTILHPNGAHLLQRQIEGENDVIMETVKKATTVPVHAANLLTVVHAIINLFKHSQFFPWLQAHRSKILDALSSCQSSFDKNSHISYSSLLLNYSVLLIQLKDEAGQSQILSAALAIAEDRNQDVDSRFQSLVAVGTLMLDGHVKSTAIELGVKEIVKEAKVSRESKIAEVGADLEFIVTS